MLKDVDFVDLVAVGFGVVLLGAIIVAYFKGVPMDSDIKSWFYAILTFFIGKKLPQTFGK
jgi:hypothetical protein